MRNANCQKCNGQGYVATSRDGRMHAETCECVMFALPADCHEHAAAKIDTLPDTVRQLAEGWPDMRLVLTGPAGVGKTWAAVAIARRMPFLTFVWWPDWVDEYRGLDIGSDPRDAADFLRRTAAAKNLVLDDIGADAGSEYNRRVLLKLLHQRCKHRNVATIITSNSALDAISTHDDRIASRLQANSVVIACSGKDKRTTRPA